MVIKLNNLFGYYRQEGVRRFSKLLGAGQLFCLPNGMDNSLVKKQTKKLNHYMIRRIRHLHLRDVPNNRGKSVRAWRESVDKAYRQLGLRTIIDAFNKMEKKP